MKNLVRNLKLRLSIKNLFIKIKEFIIEAAQVAFKRIVDFFKGVYDHAETVVVLVLAAFGLANILGELPFLITLPLWVETPFVAPVLAVLGIKLLLKLADKRSPEYVIAS